MEAKKKFEFKSADLADFSRHEIEEKLQWRLLGAEVPFLDIPRNLQIKIIPPFAGASMRFLARDKKNPDKAISVYFDAHNSLGFMGCPYWEIYPNHEDSNQRFVVGEENQMFLAIQKALKKGMGFPNHE